jgi:hypothetical protein
MTIPIFEEKGGIGLPVSELTRSQVAGEAFHVLAQVIFQSLDIESMPVTHLSRLSNQLAHPHFLS